MPFHATHEHTTTTSVEGVSAADLVLVDATAEHDIRWRPGERLDRLLERLVEAGGRADALAVDAGARTLTYRQLDAQANQLARHLLVRGIGSGCRVGLVLDDPVDAYLGMLAVLKVNAAYVPMDPGFPPDRLSYIVADAGVDLVLSASHLLDRLRETRAAVVHLDRMAERIAEEDPGPLTDAERGVPVDELAYVIYTSGSTGRPKGVAVDHASICDFVRVAARTMEFWRTTGRIRG
jgi:non-ribosomal peptide synthetase component F